MTGPYEGLEKIKRGQYSYKVAGVYVTITKVDDKLWKLTTNGAVSADPFVAIKAKLPKLFAFEQAMNLVRVEGVTLHAIYYPLDRLVRLLAKHTVANNPVLLEKQLTEAPVGSRVNIPHLRDLGGLSRDWSWTKSREGKWRPTGANPHYHHVVANHTQLAEWSQFGDAEFEPYNGEKLEMNKAWPTLRIADCQVGVTQVLFSYEDGKAIATVYFSSTRSSIRFQVDTSQLPVLMIPNPAEAEEVDQETFRAEAMGCDMMTVALGSYECSECGREISEGERYLNDSKALKTLCMSCAFPSEHPRKESADPMERIARAQERVATAYEKLAKEVKLMGKYGPVPVYFGRF